MQLLFDLLLTFVAIIETLHARLLVRDNRTKPILEISSLVMHGLDVVILHHVSAELKTLDGGLQQVLAIIKGHLSAAGIVSVLGCELVTHVERFDHAVHGGFHCRGDVSLGVSGVKTLDGAESAMAEFLVIGVLTDNLNRFLVGLDAGFLTSPINGNHNTDCNSYHEDERNRRDNYFSRHLLFLALDLLFSKTMVEKKIIGLLLLPFEYGGGFVEMLVKNDELGRLYLYIKISF
ncbi:hypothetical protein PHAVU_001G217200, partial [Phaseolus vulgaris]|uniref:Uncharacterized protein n=1 Tax=Phaseolus vulgaris TaxID=3885 RepID=V7D0R5_PHAVU|nr:hypothetical protein PHAVU_001G2172001g [Phaseolus vulgaris]ESW35228.1 hypothetical protein PHAVU_001G2172001g [Phaseolus vulgaris]